jgi:hypothetical protein
MANLANSFSFVIAEYDCQERDIEPVAHQFTATTADKFSPNLP